MMERSQLTGDGADRKDTLINLDSWKDPQFRDLKGDENCPSTSKI
jgi:hypothetical protein